ncbi:MAG: hypothetical protein RMM10_05710 [Anaerolineae bacterium]|nr:hypothetical protein [Thermoflexus sp.]MCS7351007.1 hypothetical protein [Thermoflexus sp.]MDW8180459.1 hypothetical protein [Anaerolineae bacterium]
MHKVFEGMLSEYLRVRAWLRGWLEDARGLQTLEWVALAIVILAFLGAIAAFLGNQGENTVGRAVVGAIQHFFQSLTQQR